jgi:hypothetical protein
MAHDLAAQANDVGAWKLNLGDPVYGSLLKIAQGDPLEYPVLPQLLDFDVDLRKRFPIEDYEGQNATLCQYCGSKLSSKAVNKHHDSGICVYKLLYLIHRPNVPAAGQAWHGLK